MPASLAIEDFGSQLKYLRKRAHLTQRDLAQAVGYTEAHICRLEKNERLPDLTTVAALFIPALDIKNDPVAMENLLQLAAEAHGGRKLTKVKLTQVTIEHLDEQGLGALEEIPALPAQRVDRATLLARIRALLAREHALALCGMAGTGKTSLAAALAREYQGPVFWHTLTAEVNTSAEAILRQLALFLFSNGQSQLKPLVERRSEAAPIALDQQLVQIRAALGQRPALLCFEDAHLLANDETSLSLLKQLSGLPAVSLLLTSRQGGLLPIAEINVSGLEPAEARDLVRRLGLALDEERLARLLVRTGRNPMLLRLAAGQLIESQLDPDAFIEHLETHPQVAAYLLDTLLRDLSPAAEWLVALLAVFRHPLDLYDELLIELAQKYEPTVRFEAALSEIHPRHLVDNPRCASLHPLVRDHLYATLGTDASRKKRVHRLAAEWSEAAGNLVEAAHHWTRAGDLEQAAEVLGDRSEDLFNRGQASAAVQVVDEALERAARKRGDTSALRRRLLTARGDLLRGTFRAADAEASYREALSLAQSLPAVRAQIVRNLAQILLQRGRSAEALTLCQSAMADLGDADVLLRARLASIQCRAHLVLSQFDEAERIANLAIELANQFAEALPQTANDVWARAERTLGWINYTRHPEGTESLAHYRRALDCARAAGLRVIECAILSNTATALMERGDTQAALKTYEDALHGYESLGDMYGVAGVLHNLGVLHGVREEYDEALRRFEQSSEIERLVGDHEGLLSSEGARASILINLNRLAEARSILDMALTVGESSNDTWALGTALCLLTEVQLMQGEIETAQATIQRTLSMPGMESNARIRAWAQSDLALVQIGAGQFDDARVTVAGEPPADLGFELTIRWRQVQSAAALACGDVETSRQIAQAVLKSAQEKGLKQLELVAQALLDQPERPPCDLPRIILIGPEA
jgi:ATP/maltotriose-dependent transcriptional regulator MalT/DNA-binding XRE family transcriptional regulator